MYVIHTSYVTHTYDVHTYIHGSPWNKEVCICAGRGVYVRGGVYMCEGVCIGTGRGVYGRGGVYVCEEVCICARRCVYV